MFHIIILVFTFDTSSHLPCITLALRFIAFETSTPLLFGSTTCRAFDNVSYSGDSQFLKLYYGGRGSWNEETETLLFPSNGTTPVNILREDASRVKEYYEQAKRSVFKMPELDQFDPDKCTAHAAKCCWPRDRQAGDNNGNCASPYDSECVDKDAGK